MDFKVDKICVYAKERGKTFQIKKQNKTNAGGGYRHEYVEIG